jgi:hypothetical protein
MATKPAPSFLAARDNTSSRETPVIFTGVFHGATVMC